MRSLVSASLLLVLLVGCQNQQSQMNPFGITRLPPPPTQSYGQSAQTAPYYQGPATTTAPTIQGGYQQQPSLPQSSYPQPTYQQQSYPQQTPPPAQFNPPVNSYPQQQWQSRGGISQTTSSSDVVAASHTESVGTAPVSGGSTTEVSASKATTVVGSSSNTPSNPYLRGMRVNEVSEVSQPASTPIAPPTTSTLPSSAGWSSTPATFSAPADAQPIPSRIP